MCCSQVATLGRVLLEVQLEIEAQFLLMTVVLQIQIETQASRLLNKVTLTACSEAHKQGVLATSPNEQGRAWE